MSAAFKPRLLKHKRTGQIILATNQSTIHRVHEISVTVEGVVVAGGDLGARTLPASMNDFDDFEGKVEIQNRTAVTLVSSAVPR